MEFNKMPIKKLYIGLCDCHNKLIRSENEEYLLLTLSNNIICPKCNTIVKYKGFYEMDGNIIIDENFKEEKIEIEKSSRSKNNREPMTKEKAIRENFINKNGMPYCKGNRKPSNGALLLSIKFAIEEQDIEKLNQIFYLYSENIKDNAAKYINKKQRKFLKQYMNIDFE